jgi:hypothetical protein
MRDGTRDLFERPHNAREARDRLIRRVGYTADMRKRFADRFSERGDLLVDAVQGPIHAAQRTRERYHGDKNAQSGHKDADTHADV